MWFDPGLAGLFITSTLLHLGEDINLLVVSLPISFCLTLRPYNLDISKERCF